VADTGDDVDEDKKSLAAFNLFLSTALTVTRHTGVERLYTSIRISIYILMVMHIVSKGDKRVKNLGATG
jgi:hypothetical protein